ncbi:MAG: putative PEP-binding protein [Solirubrobacteraceae bacterium]
MTTRRPRLLLNLSVPALAAKASTLPADGVGLLRAEFLALSAGVHPSSVLADGGSDEYVALFRDGLREVAEAFHPRPITFRLSDLKTNEYRGLRGGDEYEPHEENPMLGRRGAFRYLGQPEAFALELRAVREVREAGFTGVRIMVPFVRTVPELRAVRALIAEAGLGDTEVWMMAEVPSVALLPETFAREADGVSIGSNDLCQLVLGVDRDSAELSRAYTVDDPAVRSALRRIIEGAHAVGRPVSICGDQPAENPDLVADLVDAGIDAISVVPSAFEATRAVVDELCGPADAG